MTIPADASAYPEQSGFRPAGSGDRWEKAGVRLEQDGPVATVVLCRPRVRNAQTPAMWQAFRDISRELPALVRVVVIRAEGSAFSAGLDRALLAPGTGAADHESLTLPDLAALDPDRAAEIIEGFQQAFDWLRRPDLLSIAAVGGPAVGAGFQLALACDLRVLTPEGYFAMSEVSLGLVPDLTGTKHLVDLVGYARALEICVTGRRVDAHEADRIGLANLVVPSNDLDAAVRDLTAAVLVADRDVVIEIKALLAGATGRDHRAQQAAERAAQVRRIRDLAGLGE